MINEQTTKYIWDSVPEEEKWVARKFIEKMDEHKRRYPAFKEERVAEMFVRAEMKYKKAYCYKPIKSFTKTIHFCKSMASLAASERD